MENLIDRRHGRMLGEALDLKYQWRVFQVPWIPDKKVGDYEVSSFYVSDVDESITRLRAALNIKDRPFEADRYVEEGTYKKLTYKNQILMTDTRTEILEHEILLRQEGKVLLHGLGLGVALMMLLSRPKVTHVTVVEIAAPVINMVVPIFRDLYESRRFTVIHGDAFSWKPRRSDHWDFVWHDIWNTISVDNFTEMEKLRKRFLKYSHRQGAWSRQYVQYLRRKHRK